MDFEAWVERARAVPIESEITRRHLTLKRSGAERIGPCPRCGGTDRFSINVKEGVWNCRQCKPANIPGDVIGLVEFLDGCDFLAACEELTHEPRPNGEDKGNGRGTPLDELGPVVAAYDYTDEAGQLLFQVTRHAVPEKTFRQRRPDGRGGWISGTKGMRMVPYRLPELLEAIALEHVVLIPEGEKDVDTLATLGVPATCNPRGAGKWGSCKIDSFFAGADVVIIADNDPQAQNKKTGELLAHSDGRPRFAGWDHAHDVAAHLSPIAARVRVLDLKKLWRECPEKGDVSDYVAAGGALEALYGFAEELADWAVGDEKKLPGIFNNEIPLLFPFPIKGTDIPRRPWIVPGLLLRRQVTVMVAPPGSGKSLLTLQLAMVCSAGRTEWGGWRPRGRFRVLVINAEEDEDEIKRRLYAAKQDMNLADELLGEFALAKEKDDIIIAKADARTKTVIRTPMLDRIIATVNAHQIDIVIVDPFAETFVGDENSNSELKWAGVLWREVARRCNAAVLLVHHTKKYAHDMAGDPDAGRGGGSLVGIARIVSTVFSMTEHEAKLFHIKPFDRVRYIRFDDAKANQSLITLKARWFFKKTYSLPNGNEKEPADEVGVLVPWKPPADDLSEAEVCAALAKLEIGLKDDKDQSLGDPYTLSRRGRSNERWAGHVIKDLRPDWEDSRVVELLETWLGTFLEETEQPTSKSKGQLRKGLKVIAKPGVIEETALADPKYQFGKVIDHSPFIVIGAELDHVCCEKCGRCGSVYLIRDPLRGVASHALHEACAEGFYRHDG